MAEVEGYQSLVMGSLYWDSVSERKGRMLLQVVGGLYSWMREVEGTWEEVEGEVAPPSSLS